MSKLSFGSTLPVWGIAAFMGSLEIKGSFIPWSEDCFFSALFSEISMAK